jgi:hypothetical protein
MVSIADFIARVQSVYKTGIAREHAYRPALHDLLKALGDDLTPVNDPAKSEVGAPDFIILKGNIPIGHLEASPSIIRAKTPMSRRRFHRLCRVYSGQHFRRAPHYRNSLRLMKIVPLSTQRSSTCSLPWLYQKNGVNCSICATVNKKDCPPSPPSVRELETRSQVGLKPIYRS